MPNGKPISIKDIANELNIAISTVHKALTGKPGVSEERRKQVVDTARSMGYVANSAARSLARKSMTLGIIMPYKWQEYFADMKAGISARIERLREYNKVNGAFFYVRYDTLSEDIISWVEENHVDAILYCPSHYSMNRIVEAALKTLTLPVFCAGAQPENPVNIADITIDSELSGKLAADFLKCTASNIKCALFTGSLKICTHRQKAQAFCKRIGDAGGQVVEIYETEDDIEKAHAAIAHLISNHPDVGGIYVSTSTSDPICEYIEKRGLTHIKLIGTDVFDSLKCYMKKGIMHASIYQNQIKVGEIAVQCAYEYLSRARGFGDIEQAVEKKLLIRPNLLLCADIE